MCVPLIKGKDAQLLSSLVASLVDVDDDDLSSDESGPSVHFHSRLRLRRPATGVSGHESLSESDESRLSPALGIFGRGELSNEAKEAGLEEGDCSDETVGGTSS